MFYNFSNLWFDQSSELIIGSFINRTGTSFEDARAGGRVWTPVYFDYLMAILDARAVAN